MRWNQCLSLGLATILAVVIVGCASLSKPDTYTRAVEALDSNDPVRESKAIDNLKAILARQPDHHEAHNLLGLYAYQSGDYESAIEEFRAAIHLNPLSEIYRHNLVLAFTHAGKLEEAQQALDETLRLYPDDPNLVLDQAVLLHISGDNHAALELLDRVENLSPSLRQVDELRKQWSEP